jgi:hypothetical protein
MLAVAICMVLMTRPDAAQDGSTPLLTIESIETAAGSEADARAVFLLVTAHQGTEFVRLSDEGATALLARCGHYWIGSGFFGRPPGCPCL